MRFSELMRRAGATQVVLSGDPEVRRVIQDSREAQPGDLFVAVRGLTVDGHSFLRDVVRAGACAAVVEDAALLPADTPHAVVADARIALAKVAAQLLGEPTRALTLVGITGTNGKTTTTYLVEAIAAEAGLSAGVIGTVGYRYAGRTLPSPHTTPDPVALQRLFADMRDAGVRVVAMETSSHALEQRRVEGCDFSIAAFSNLTQDHLDYHGSMDAYFEAKARFFTELLPASTASAKACVINLDDPRGGALAARCQGRVLTFSKSDPRADVRAAAVQLSEQGVAAQVHTPAGIVALASPLVGTFNLENLLCAIGIGVALSVPVEVIARALGRCRGAPGRLERVDNTQGIGVFVDYAHTPDALERVLSAVREQTRGRLISVFGCGGDRDRTKRPLMGGIAARLSDLAIVTSDNPRTETPESIVAMVAEGARAEGTRELSADAALAGEAGGFTIEVDRRRAIALALRAARRGDCVVIAGKGHEDYQILGKTKVHFDDREEARAALEALA